MTDCILTHLESGVLQIKMNRPKTKNALNLEMYEAMANHLVEGEQNKDIKAFLFCGEGGSYTSGNDIQDFLSNPPTSEASPVLQFLQALTHTQKPIVAAVSGVAIGIGTTMLLHCDLVYADNTARFQLPFINLGLCPEAASSFLLPQIVGHPKAAELLLLGEPFNALEAKELKLINDVTPSDALSYAMEKALLLAKKPPQALLMSKSLLKAAKTNSIAEAMSHENKVFLKLLGGPEAKEALSAFMEKRAPNFCTSHLN